ncbi:fibronectin type III domain-containing protein [Pseudonocardia charpentierae]|uniref:Fibronectin type III domain-containing protein n=1 Tax=Pseudonocardia charpentierae TaxID=3075545 RepID=A0ABU2NHQ0_9PSEU|nr:fibronectin type III domain-containing protein [Pseudonocardia sp. DSM 45834]MDT0353493.1 fibronectin type III domain-containing protein [Pseudonocardia sp. DSM 45834]
MRASRWVSLLLLLLGALLCLGAAAPEPPGIPTSVTVGAGDAAAVVRWSPPEDDGGATISGYTVTALPGGATAAVSGVAREATVEGLSNGVAYRFTVTASNRVGAGPTSAVSNAVTPAPAAAAVGPVVLHEDFATSTGSMEPVAGGTWSTASGRYVLSAPADGGEEVPNANLAVAGTTVTGDFTLTALGSATATDSRFNDFSVVFGYHNPADYWFVSFSEGNDPNTSGVFRVGGLRTELVDVASPIVAGAVYPIRVERRGPELRVFRAGEQVASVTDAASTDGRVGFGSRNDGGTFDDLVVTGPVRSSPVKPPESLLARLWNAFSSLFSG